MAKDNLDRIREVRNTVPEDYRDSFDNMMFGAMAARLSQKDTEDNINVALSCLKSCYGIEVR